MSELTASDVLAMTKNENGFLGGTGSTLLIVLILFFLGMNGGLFGGNGNQAALTRADVNDAISTQTIESSIGNLGTAMNNGFAGINIGMNNGFSQIQNSMCSGFGTVNSNIANLGYQMSQCCCQMKEAVRDSTDSVKSLINEINLTNLHNSLDDKNREILQAQLTASQLAQTNSLENYLRSMINGCGCS